MLTSTSAMLDRMAPAGAAAPNHIQRRRQLRAAYRRLVLHESVQVVARRFRVTPRTIQLWVKRALNYDDDRARALRTQVEWERRR